MRTKINAAKIAMQSGCNMVIANGRLENIIVKVVTGEDIGTLFTGRSIYTNKERWMLFACPRGKISVDEGAETALRKGGSLLPCGIIDIEGAFEAGEIVRIGTFAKGIVNFSSEDLNDLKKRCAEEKSMGANRVGNDRVAIDNNNIVIL